MLEKKQHLNRYSKPIQAYKPQKMSLKESLCQAEMEGEDLLSKYTYLKEINEEEQEKHLELKDIKNEYFFLLQKDQE